MGVGMRYREAQISKLRRPATLNLLQTEDIAVSECALIIDVLKRTLKNRGLTYRDLAKKVGLSEASVKRVFAEETFTLQRLEKVCSAVGITMSELVRMATEKAEPSAHYLSIEQEQ